MRSLASFFVFWAIMLLSISPMRVYALPLILIDYDVTSDTDTRKINFTLTFDRTPDFDTYDTWGRQADCFSIDILNNPLMPYMLTGFGGEDIRIISGSNPHGEGTPGYFSITTPRQDGTNVIETFQYQLEYTTVIFSTTFDQLQEVDGEFEAVLFTYHFGACNDPLNPIHIAGAPIPESTTTLLFGLGVTGLAAIRRKRKSVTSG